ncbi:MAG: stilbene synthase [Verrucomicrobiota bacterium]
MYLQSIASAVPPFSYTQAECWEEIKQSPSAGKLRSRSMSILEKVLLNGSGIEKRQFFIPEPAMAFERSAETLNRQFEEYAPVLSREALEKALASAGMEAADLDALFVCTCTGYLCPGVSSHVAEAMGMRGDASLHDIVGLGCGAAIPLMRSADGFLAANPGATVATVAVEICSSAFYLDDDPGVLISLCLFGDAAAAAIWRGESGEAGQWRTGGWQTLHQPEHREKIRFVNAGGALKNQLHKSVPGVSSEAVGRLFEERYGGDGEGVKIVSHGGGRDVVDAIERRLGLEGERALVETRAILNENGNCSSPSVLMGLERYLAGEAGAERIWLTSFGAGFTAHACELTRGDC